MIFHKPHDLRGEEIDEEEAEGGVEVRRKQKNTRRSNATAWKQLDGALVLELASRGTIKSIFDSFDADEQRNVYFDVPRCAAILAQISSAVAFLHTIKVVHRDLSPGNCFVISEAPLVIKIGDFGQSFLFKDAKLPDYCGGTPGFYPRYKPFLFKTFYRRKQNSAKNISKFYTDFKVKNVCCFW